MEQSPETKRWAAGWKMLLPFVVTLDTADFVLSTPALVFMVSDMADT